MHDEPPNQLQKTHEALTTPCGIKTKSTYTSGLQTKYATGEGHANYVTWILQVNIQQKIQHNFQQQNQLRKSFTPHFLIHG